LRYCGDTYDAVYFGCVKIVSDVHQYRACVRFILRLVSLISVGDKIAAVCMFAQRGQRTGLDF